MDTLIDLFNTFKDRGDKTVFVYRTGVRRFEYSYIWLHEQSLKFATYLESQGVNKGDRVLLWAPNSHWWGVVFWGCILRGVVVVPVDFMSDKERAESITELSGAKLIIQSQYKIDRITESIENIKSQKTLLIEDLGYSLQNLQLTTTNLQLSPSDIAELIYTSGTTGNPKGVMLTHKNLTTNIKQLDQHVSISSKYRLLSLLPLSHTFEQMGGFLVALNKGCTMVYLRTLKPSAINQALHEEDIYTMMIVPRLLQALKNSIEREFENKHLSGAFKWLQKITANSSQATRKKVFFLVQKNFGNNFKFFTSGGAALDQATFSFWQSLGFKVIEGYGLTETSPALAANTLDKQVLGSVGQLLPGVNIKIHDKEILAQGDNIFSGYWENSSATAEAFINFDSDGLVHRSPDGHRDEGGWFKTGDIGEFDTDGNLYIKGRIKEMIVTGSGVNIYPGDIEPVLNSVEGVKEACVIGLDRGQGEEVHAILILKDENNPEQIIKQANSKLDSSQQITDFSIYPENEFPKTTTLKIKKFQVKQKLSQDIKDSDNLPANILSSLIAKVTGKPYDKITDDTILVQDLGLTSVARLELVSFIEQEFRLDLEDTVINQNTTVAMLRQTITKREKVSKHKIKSHFWPHTKLVRGIQYILDKTINWPIFRYLVKLEVKGVENLENIKGPVLFIANHESYLDGPSIYAGLPSKWRYHLAAGSFEAMFFPKKPTLVSKLIGRIFFEYLSLLCGIFLLEEKKGLTRVIQFMGKLVDRNVNILIFPEGGITRSGKMQAFKPGLGIIVKELKVPVIPIKISGTYEILPKGTRKIKRGKARLKIGPPLYFSKESPSEIVEQSRKVILNM